MSNFAANLEHYREKRELTVAEAAELAGTHRNVWYRLENGDRWVGSEERLEAIAEALGVSVSSLFRDR